MRRPTCAAPRRRRASVVLMFAVFALPILLMSISLAWDATRLEVARRQLDASTNSAAIAAAWGTLQERSSDRNSATPTIDPASARLSAAQTYCMSLLNTMTVAVPPDGGVGPSTAEECTGAMPPDRLNAWGLTVQVPPVNASAVQVNGRAVVPGLLMMRMLTGGRDPEIVSYATAGLCSQDGRAGGGEGGCSRPRFGD